MQDLTLLPVSMTSLEIAEITCKPHKLILRSIRKILAELEQNKEVLPIIRSNNVLDYEAVYPTAKHAQYIDSAGNPHTMYILNKRFAQLVSMEVDIVRRLVVLNKLEYIEEQNRQLLLQHIADQEKIADLTRKQTLEGVHNMAMEACRQISEEKAAQRKLRAERTLLSLELYQLKQRGRRIR